MLKKSNKMHKFTKRHHKASTHHMSILVPLRTQKSQKAAVKNETCQDFYDTTFVCYYTKK